MMLRGYHLVAVVAAAIAFAAFGLWLVTLVVVTLAATLGARDVIDDELRAQRMAVVAATVAPDQKLGRARLEQLVDNELRVLSGNHTSVAGTIEIDRAVLADNNWTFVIPNDVIDTLRAAPIEPAPTPDTAG